MSTSSQPLPFADLLRRYRLGAGLTQEQLAEATRLGLRGVSDLECGMRTSPRNGTVERLADALELGEPERAAFLSAARRQRPSSNHGARLVPGAVASGVTVLPPPPPLVGRTRELARIERMLAGTRPPVLLLAGQPGIGKSCMLEEARRLHSMT